MIPIALCIFTLSAFVAANTETFIFPVPNYYNIPAHIEPYTGHTLSAINSTTRVLTDFPILDVYNYNLLQTVVSLPYNFHEKPREQLLVKLNNYGDTTFDANDVINVKLCWPATIPVTFQLDHRFIRASDLGLAEQHLKLNTLDIYVVIDYEADFYAVREVHARTIDFNLVVSKLPNRIPIPIELYDFIVYVVDVCILLASVYPYILAFIEKTFF